MRICVIDDDVFVRDALALGLGDAGHEVVVAPGAAAGLDIVRRDAVDAIVTDMNMPGTSGAQLISEARAAWPNMPIVAISGGDRGSVLEGALALGADALLSKPFRARELVAVLEGVLAQRRRADVKS